jgi:hypothetical protein
VRSNAAHPSRSTLLTPAFRRHSTRPGRRFRAPEDFLVGEGYADEDVSFIRGEGKVLPRGRGRDAGQKWQHYYTPGLKAWVREKENFLFKLFPEFDV